MIEQWAYILSLIFYAELFVFLSTDSLNLFLLLLCFISFISVPVFFIPLTCDLFLLCIYPVQLSNTLPTFHLSISFIFILTLHFLLIPSLFLLYYYFCVFLSITFSIFLRLFRTHKMFELCGDKQISFK